MDKTWVVMCPKSDNGNHTNQRQGWSLFRNELESIGSDYSSPKMMCTVCGNKFSLHQGVREAFTSDLAIDYFLHNASERGAIEVEVGKVSRISFAEPFEGSPTINLTPHFNVHAASAQVSASGFTLLSCSSSGEESKGSIGWCASGNRAYGAVPIWRGLLSNAKEGSDNSSGFVTRSVVAITIGGNLNTELIIKKEDRIETPVQSVGTQSVAVHKELEATYSYFSCRPTDNIHRLVLQFTFVCSHRCWRRHFRGVEFHKGIWSSRLGNLRGH
jgi:hypothetical protein